MVTIVEPTQRQSLTLRTGSGQIHSESGEMYHGSDPILELADNVGLVDAMSQINQEGREYQEEVRMNYENPDSPSYSTEINDYAGEEESSPSEEFMGEEEREPIRKRPRKKKNADDKVVSNLRYQPRHEVDAKDQEKERYERQLAAEKAIYEQHLEHERNEKERVQLQLKKRDLDDGISKISNVMLDAKINQDHESEIHSNILLQKYLAEQHKLDDKINILEQNSAPVEVDHEQQEYEEILQQELYRISDTRDLKSPAYSTFLQKYPICNPYHPDYDREIAEEVWGVRKSYNRQLKIDGHSQYIGQPDYYEDVDEIIDNHFGKSKQPSKPQNRGQPVDQYGDNSMRYENSGGKHTVSVSDGEHYDAGYAPNYDPGFRKSTDYRNNDGQFADGSAPSRGQPQRYAPPPGYAEEYTHPQNQYQGRPSVASVNRSQTVPAAQSLPQLDSLEYNLARSMPMRDKTGRLLSEQERVMVYRQDKGERLNGANRR